MLRKCVLTVLSETNNFSAIASFEKPCASKSTICSSLRVSVSSGATGGVDSDEVGERDRVIFVR